MIKNQAYPVQVPTWVTSQLRFEAHPNLPSDDSQFCNPEIKASDSLECQGIVHRWCNTNIKVTYSEFEELVIDDRW